MCCFAHSEIKFVISNHCLLLFFLNSKVHPQLLGNVCPAPAWLIFNVADLEASIYMAFNYSGQFKLTVIAAFFQIFTLFFCVQLIKLLSSVVYNCLIRVLLIIVIKESSIHIRKRKKIFSTLVMWFIRLILTKWSQCSGDGTFIAFVVTRDMNS